MSNRSLTVEQVLALLVATPPRLAELTLDLTESQLHAAPHRGEWSANEVLAHLRACADVWGSCMMTIISQDRPTIRAINPRTWIKDTNYLEQEFRSSLGVFSKQRTQLLKVLEPLASKGWSRTAMVTGAGKPLELTVLSYAQRMAVHERPHLKQIERMVSALRK
jgi:hypothetical protein